MSKKIYCDGCGRYEGELENGSKIRHGLKFVCEDCYDKMTRKKPISTDLPDPLKAVFGM